MRSFPLLIRDTLYDETIQYFLDNVSCKILKFEVYNVNNTKKDVLYRLRLTFTPTHKSIYITFLNELELYEPPHISSKDVLLCLNADLLWWYEGCWARSYDGRCEQSFSNYKRFYTKYMSPFCSLSEYVLYKNEVIILKKFFGSDYEAFYYLPLC